MNFLPLLESKRDGAALTEAQLQSIITATVAGEIPDYQVAAFLMVIYFRGLSPAETRALTLAMRDSGDTLSFPADGRPVVDKHSTGGVGDKASLPLSPLLACLGFRVPMISGRGLGITGGTLDKMASIPGFQTFLSRERILEIVDAVGCVMVGQTANMVPADRKLYALRDVTATVPSIALLTSSILSKKLAEGLEALVLDVKWGRAAFMQTREGGEELARALVELSNACGVKTDVILSDMNVPLGRTAGNWVEVVESVECLEGGGPQDLRDLVLDLAAHLLVSTGKEPTPEAALRRAVRCLDSGAPREKWNQMLVAQGADLAAFEAKLKAPAPVFEIPLLSERAGIITDLDARIIGEVVRDLGGGRLTQDSVLNLEVGICGMKKPGERVESGEALAVVRAASEKEARAQKERLLAAWVIGS